MHRLSHKAPPSIVPLLLVAAATIASPSRAQEALPAIEVNGSWLGEETEKSVKTYPGARTVLGKKEWLIPGSGVMRRDAAVAKLEAASK